VDPFFFLWAFEAEVHSVINSVSVACVRSVQDNYYSYRMMIDTWWRRRYTRDTRMHIALTMLESIQFFLLFFSSSSSVMTRIRSLNAILCIGRESRWYRSNRIGSSWYQHVYVCKTNVIASNSSLYHVVSR
jgi:hypothetical protein